MVCVWKLNVALGTISSFPLEKSRWLGLWESEIQERRDFSNLLQTHCTQPSSGSFLQPCIQLLMQETEPTQAEPIGKPIGRGWLANLACRDRDL